MTAAIQALAWKSSLTEHIEQPSFAAQCNHDRCPSSSIQSRCQVYHCPLSAADIQVSDHQGDVNRLIRPLM